MESDDIMPPVTTSSGLANQDKSDSNLPKQSTSKTPILIAVGFIASLMLFGFGGYYLGKKSSNTNNLTVEQPLPLTTTTVSPTQVANPTRSANSLVDSLPSGWKYRNNGECGVQFGIPPKVPPYYQPADSSAPPSVTDDKGSGRFWDFPRGGVYPNLLSKLLIGNQEYNQSSAMFASVDEASGYISSAVVVSCFPNTNNFNNTSLLSSLKAKLKAYNQDPGENEMQASSYTIKTSNEVDRWGNKVIDLSVSEYYSNPGGQPITNAVDYSMFSTPKYIYEVRVMGASDDLSVQDTAKQIFLSLSFE